MSVSFSEYEAEFRTDTPKRQPDRDSEIRTDKATGQLTHVEFEVVVKGDIIGGIPVQMIEAYGVLASAHASVRQTDPGVWVATVAGLEGAWADGDNSEEALAALPEAIAGWAAVKLRTGNAASIPVIEGLSLTPPQR